jgi:hypothetical protein
MTSKTESIETIAKYALDIGFIKINANTLFCFNEKRNLADRYADKKYRRIILNLKRYPNIK